MSIKIHKADNAQSIGKCFDAMQSLRPSLKKETFTKRIESMIENGYHLIYIEEENQAAAVAGYRFTELLAWGKSIYIDDLNTLPSARGKGYASALLDHIEKIARENGCEQIHLDSGCNEGRYDAHRLYLNKRFNITSHHFALKLK